MSQDLPVNDQRLEQLRLWVAEQLKTPAFDLSVASADASFRRYFRIEQDGHSWIAMDAPPEKENCEAFVRIARHLTEHDIHAPIIHYQDMTQGFLLLSDLGNTQYLSVLNEDNVDELYKQAIDTIIRLQSVQADDLPAYDRKLLMAEMALFPDWFIKQHLQLAMSPEQEHLLSISIECLTENALQQPAVFVHRDYHSRNLMLTDNHNPGILDFQDAVRGAISYDLASLLKDCYISWPRQQTEQWLDYYLQLAKQNNLINNQVSFEEFVQWFDFMAVQRHLKAIGIFARLNIRDGKPGYLKDIPRTMQYIVDSCERYPQLEPLKTFLQSLKVIEQLDLSWPAGN